MDDLLYFLLLIGWLAFSFYQQSVKKKKRQEEMRAAQERQQHMHEEPDHEQEYQTRSARTFDDERERTPDFKKTLEEILLGEQLMEDDVEDEPVREENVRERFERNSTGNKHNIYQKYFDSQLAKDASASYAAEPEKLEDKIEQLEEEMVLHEEDSVEERVGQEQPRFDLRQAIIYSEIINRRY
jgi:hypothetical protein